MSEMDVRDQLAWLRNHVAYLRKENARLEEELAGVRAIKRHRVMKKICSAKAYILCPCGEILRNFGDEHGHMEHMVDAGWGDAAA